MQDLDTQYAAGRAHWVAGKLAGVPEWIPLPLKMESSIALVGGPWTPLGNLASHVPACPVLFKVGLCKILMPSMAAGRVARELTGVLNEYLLPRMESRAREPR